MQSTDVAFSYQLQHCQYRTECEMLLHTSGPSVRCETQTSNLSSDLLHGEVLWLHIQTQGNKDKDVCTRMLQLSILIDYRKIRERTAFPFSENPLLF